MSEDTQTPDALSGRELGADALRTLANEIEAGRMKLRTVTGIEGGHLQLVVERATDSPD